MVLALSFWVGIVGIVLALPTTFGLSHVAEVMGTRMLLPHWLLGSVMVVTMAMAVLSGLAALRSLRLTEPASLLRLRNASKWEKNHKRHHQILQSIRLARSFGKG